MRYRKKILLAIPFVLLTYIGLTYVPHKAVSIDQSNVSRITIFDGNTGKAIDITDTDKINHIISNLRDITFQKGKPSFWRMGYSYRTTFYDDNGEVIEELIISSNDTIRYKGFFYTAKDYKIDYNYVEQLFN